MRVIFLGTPEFSVLPLKTIFDKNGIELVAVVCNEDKKVGRKQILTYPPVKQFAIKNNIKFLQYNKIRKEGVLDIKALNPDLMITCAFGQILSQEILDIPKLGVINIHASLLPKYRGASPVQACLLNGEKTTGITIMQTDIGIDTGDIILQKSLSILENEDSGELFKRLSILGAECIDKALDMIMQKEIVKIKQDETKASYSKMIKNEDALINFNEEAEKIINKIRAYNPSPVAFTYLNEKPLKIFSASLCNLSGKPGEVLSNKNELIIAAKDLSIKILILQKCGGKKMDIANFLRGNNIEKGYIFKC